MGRDKCVREPLRAPCLSVYHRLRGGGGGDGVEIDLLDDDNGCARELLLKASVLHDLLRRWILTQRVQSHFLVTYPSVFQFDRKNEIDQIYIVVYHPLELYPNR